MAMEGVLTSVYAGRDLFRPTFFELFAKEQLMDALRPAIGFVVDVLGERAPRRLRGLLARWDALYALGLMVLEARCLRAHGATLSESFYGLRREAREPQGRALTPLELVELERRKRDAPKLTPRQQLTSLVLVVLAPALAARCEDRLRAIEGLPPSAVSVSDRCLALVYPWIHGLVRAVHLIYKVLYLLEQSDVWSPGLHALGLRLVRHFPPPPVAADAAADDASRRGWLRRALDATSSAGSVSVWGLIYGLQFAQWWFNREHLLQPYRTRKVPPAPPPRPPYGDSRTQPLMLGARDASQPRRRLVLLPEDRSACPLCHRTRRNPAASSGGYVFCYPCLVQHVKQFRHCPVSGLPMGDDQIRRVIED
eukprot:TRINITY_DN27579_c0_g1_i1.p1 TRINITY_DN27579_c0_g1~~TRINITY_DN27579_c0_g1_i1.p1  ORF type:complete len:367 (+),score=39.82 TRINITY_DN27579_c0_g1_i1:86-1186(+)